MAPGSIVDGWLEDVCGQGIHADNNVTSIPADFEYGKRKRQPPPARGPHRKKRRQVLEIEAMDPIESPTRALRSGRSTRKGSAYTTSINNASASSLVKLTNTTTLSQTSTWSGSKSPTRARSRSPAKTVHDLENADPPTIYKQLRHPDAEVPTSVRTLNNNVMRAGRRGRALLPISIRPLLTPHLDECDAEDDSLFDDVADDAAPDMFRDVVRIHTNARICFESDKPEASWGEEVVRPLLDLAISRTDGRAVVENVTSTNIQPPTLIPRGSGVDGLLYEGKRVDYGLYIEPTKEEAQRVKDRLKRLPDGEVWSINQTEAYYLREKPLFSSIELKKSRSSDDPLLQLAIWNSALFKRLEGLLDLTQKRGSVLPIPSVTVCGHNWQVCYSYIEEDGRTRMLRGMVDIGSTLDIVGIYQILRALKVICSYGLEEYWPWLSGCATRTADDQDMGHKQCHRDPSVQPEPQVKWEGLAGLPQMLPDQVLKALRPESSVEMRARTKLVEFIGATASTYAVPRSYSPEAEDAQVGPYFGTLYGSKATTGAYRKWAEKNKVLFQDPVPPAMTRATIIDKSIITASNYPPTRDKLLTTTPSTLAPAQSPQLPRLRNQQMPLIKTFMPANMDSSDNGDRQDTLWTIKYPRKPVVGSSKRIWKLWNKGQRHESPFHGKDQRKGALDLRYNVESAIWLGMQIYMECDVGGVCYRNNDYVHVRPPDDNNSKFWVARILEMRAKDAYHIYAPIAWMYWPDQLVNAHMGPEAPKSGGRWYHGKHEVIASNHLDVVDIASMAGHATVAQWFEDDDDNTHHGFYWRQTFNVMTGALSSIRKYCICDDYYNPDLILVACPNKKCQLWMHKECIAENSKATSYNALPANSEDITRRKRSNINGQPTGRLHDHFTRKKNGSSVGITDSTIKSATTENLYCLKCSTPLG
ncbi:hypothetical protein V491_02127 [Pseudogymnoascus sp. VKM F-3775]|nr:hypothetical protein V491_02127 [Pseudogymnoascus sp. VKM F-3775]